MEENARTGPETIYDAHVLCRMALVRVEQENTGNDECSD